MAKRKSRKTTDEHYVDNKKFLLAMQDWKKDCSIASNLNKPVSKGKIFTENIDNTRFRYSESNYFYFRLGF